MLKLENVIINCLLPTLLYSAPIIYTKYSILIRFLHKNLKLFLLVNIFLHWFGLCEIVKEK